ncbi:aldolase [Patescibacteria group bacterium]|nr:aldolase [Patescibacteria group bacterium]MCL5091276.1 aldolase [Patescibacteria group bacterium]
MGNDQYTIPADVPLHSRSLFSHYYNLITRQSGRLMLFAGDQKVEHLNQDFVGDGIAPDDGTPEHLFRIASQGRIGALATQLGLIARYGSYYPQVSYIVKLNSHTNLVPLETNDPVSWSWYNLDTVLEFQKQSELTIAGIGYTVYLGSRYEAKMLREAAKLVYQAHQHGLIAIIWAYPKGRSVPRPKDPALIAGAAGVAATLGADFVKVNYPDGPAETAIQELAQAVRAAGNTKLICAGGPATDARVFLETLYAQIHQGGTAGNATGRNLHQKPLDDAVRFANAIYAITVEDKTVEQAMQIYQGRP